MARLIPLSLLSLLVGVVAVMVANVFRYHAPQLAFEPAFANSTAANALYKKYPPPLDLKCNLNPDGTTKYEDDPCFRLSKAIQFETVHQDTNATEFAKIREFFVSAFPLFHSTLSLEVVGRNALLYKWAGSNEDLKAVLVASHFDVVPAPHVGWTHPPFSGKIADGFIWGRGTLDDKLGVVAAMEAVEKLLAAGFKPERTFYFAFGADEELGGYEGAKQIADLIEKRGIQIEFVIDEGGLIATDAIPGLNQPVAIIGIAEKGQVSLKLTVNQPGGHSSMPAPQTPIGILSTAIHKLERHQMKAQISSGVVGRLYNNLGPHLPLLERLVLSNMWLTAPLLDWMFSKKPALNALMRTTTAPTIIHAGIKDNVLPSSAYAVVNFRIAPHDTIQGVIEHVRRVVNDERVQIEKLQGESAGSEATAVSCVECIAYETIAITARQVSALTQPPNQHQPLLTTPYLMIAMTDSRHYRKVSPNVYNFMAARLSTVHDLKRLHGVDERLAITDYLEYIQFYHRLILNAQLMGKL